MDFFESTNSSREIEEMYSKWYYQLSDERKSNMLADMVQFGIDSVRYNALKDNPFLTASEQTLEYMRYNLKEDFSPEMFSFIEEKMLNRSEKEWQERFKTMKKELGWSYESMAKYMGAGSGDAVKSSVNRQLPGFAKLAVCVFEAMSEKNKK